MNTPVPPAQPVYPHPKGISPTSHTFLAHVNGIDVYRRTYVREFRLMGPHSIHGDCVNDWALDYPFQGMKGDMVNAVRDYLKTYVALMT